MFFIKSKAFHCLLACANRPSKLKCSFWFVLVYSCFLWGGFHWNFANFSSYKTFSACRSWRFCNSKQWSGFRKSNRYSTKWHKLRNSRVEYFCCGSIVSDLKEKEENQIINFIIPQDVATELSQVVISTYKRYHHCSLMLAKLICLSSIWKMVYVLHKMDYFSF